MPIKDLEVRQGNVDIVVEVVDIGDIKEFEKYGKSGKVATAKAKDDTGEIKLSLWNEQIDKVNPGDRIHIKNGYVSEFQGEKQLTTGKFGELEVVEKSEGKEVEKAPSKELEEKKPEVTAKPEENSVEEEKVE